MANFPRLFRRKESGMYYCRVAVPKDLTKQVGKLEIKVSLKTTDYKQAKQRLLIESFKVDQQFAAMRGLPVFDLPLPEKNGAKRVLQVVEGITLSELIRRYFAAHEQQTHSPKTKLEYNIRFNTIKKFMGEHRPIVSITREDCREFQQLVMRLPPNANKSFRKMTLQEVAEYAKKNKLPVMAAKTVNQHISCLNLLLDWACRERLIDANPARGLFVRDAVKNKDKRDPFTVGQINQIFGSGLMHSYHVENSERFWIPLMALWTGARLNELCQLRVGDVSLHDDIYCILVHEGDGNRLKTAHANRIIPLHRKLLEAGFVDYLHLMQARGEEMLFPALRTSLRGYPSDLFSKWFTRYLKAAKVKTARTCFHSFRHNFRDALRDAGLEREIVQAIGGWKDKASGAEDVYGNGYSVQRLFNAISQINYIGLQAAD